MERLEEEGTQGSVKFKLRHFNKFRVLVIVTALFVALSIVFIILFAVEKAKVHKLSTPEKPKVQTYCGTKDCLFTSLGKIFYLIVG